MLCFCRACGCRGVWPDSALFQCWYHLLVVMGAALGKGALGKDENSYLRQLVINDLLDIFHPEPATDVPSDPKQAEHFMRRKVDEQVRVVG